MTILDLVDEPLVASVIQRLRLGLSLLMPHEDPPGAETPVGDLFASMCEVVSSDPSPPNVWLLLTCVSGALPTSEDVLATLRVFRLSTVEDASFSLLHRALGQSAPRFLSAAMEVIEKGVIVDVDHTARHDLHTGIQHVVRRVLPIWSSQHSLLPVAWTQPAQLMRCLSDGESSRVLRWMLSPLGENRSETHSFVPTTVLPWKSVVVLPEVPFPMACDRLTAVARFSGNSVVAIGYDCIPAVSADMVPEFETSRFGRYLSLVKHVRRIASIGATATTEFLGFKEALRAQGITGPEVDEITLPIEAGRRALTLEAHPVRPESNHSDVPLVLSVGTFEPRKNHLSLLYAAERLWREGYAFELLLIGGAGWDDSVPREIARLQAIGRPVTAIKEAAVDILRDAYQRARFTVFVSLHEGFGLPVAESFEHGTPVITSKFGSQRALGEGGGAILIDPSQDEDLVSAMRDLLRSDDLVHELRRQIRARPVRTWEDYANDVWDALITPELAALIRADSRVEG